MILRSVSLLLTLAISLAARLLGQSAQVSGGFDARLTNEATERSDEVRSPLRPQLAGVFLNLRKVWSDESGDRWIGVAQVDSDENLRHLRPYQIYGQYKGPLGKWNIRVGHYLLPFGLLANYDTERLVLQGLEESSLGIRKDTGAMVLGRFGPWDYAVSLSDGLGDVHFIDHSASSLVTARLGFVRADWQVGLSTLVGNVLRDPALGQGVRVEERRLALDLYKSFGPCAVRAEGIAGTDEGRSVGGGIVLADYALTPRLEINIRFADWNRSDDHQTSGVGLTYQLRPSLYLRIADQYHTRQENRNGFTLQLYYDFSRPL